MRVPTPELCGTTDLTCIRDKLNPRWQRVEDDSWATILTKRERDQTHMAGRYDGNWTKKPGLLSHDRKTALSSDNIVIHRQVPIEGTVLRFVEEITSVSAWTYEPFEGLIVSGAKAVTLFPSYYKTSLSIGLVPGFEPATYRSLQLS